MDFTPLALTTIVSLASAAPASLEARFPTSRYNNVLPPFATSIYYGQNGAIDYGVNRVKCPATTGTASTTALWSLSTSMAAISPTSARCVSGWSRTASTTTQLAARSSLEQAWLMSFLACSRHQRCQPYVVRTVYGTDVQL